MSFGIDYSWLPHPAIAAMKAAGVKFAARYVSPEPSNDTNGKNLQRQERDELIAEGLSVVLVYEPFDAEWMLGGYSAGVTAAQDFDAVANALDLPGIIMYGAADFDATPAQQSGINAALDGMASVVGRHRTGLYGGYYPITRALAAGHCTYAWQTLAWSGGQWNGADGIRQGLGVDVGGVNVDVDQSMGPDYGQWPRPNAPVGPGPYRHVVGAGTGHNIEWLAQHRNTTVEHIVSLSMQFCNANHRAIIQGYMEMHNGLKAVGQPSPPLPTGFVYYTTNP